MKLLKKFIKKAITQDALSPLSRDYIKGKYDSNAKWIGKTINDDPLVNSKISIGNKVIKKSGQPVTAKHIAKVMGLHDLLNSEYEKIKDPFLKKQFLIGAADLSRHYLMERAISKHLKEKTNLSNKEHWKNIRRDNRQALKAWSNRLNKIVGASQDALPSRIEYQVNYYKPKKDTSFLNYISRKNPFAYYLLQTNMPNETIKEDNLYTRIKRAILGSKTRKKDPLTGDLSNNDYVSGRTRNNYSSNNLATALNSYSLRQDMNRNKL